MKPKAYVCRNEKLLYYHGIKMDKGFANHYYHARVKDCGVCPFKKECCGNKRRQSLMFSVYRRYHKLMQERVESSEGKSMKSRRMATVEPVFGSLLNYYGMRRANAKGKQAAHKIMLMTACAYNLQKLLTPNLIQKIRCKSFLFSNCLSFILSSFSLCNTQGQLF